MEALRFEESRLRLICGSILWIISSLLTADLFLTLAGEDSIRQGVLFILAIGLEGAKILSWRKGGRAILLALSLIVLSGLGSFGAALETVKDYKLRKVFTPEVESHDEAKIRLEQVAIIEQRAILLDRLAALPVEYSTSSRDINSVLEKLRTEDQRLTEKRKGLSSTAELAQETMFDLIGRVTGMPTDTVMLVVLVFLAVNLELSALFLAGGHRDRNKFSKPSRKKSGSLPLAHKAFLDAAMEGAPLPILHGRDATAKKLGISFYEAKRIVDDLKASGTIKALGKRLVLSQD